MSLPPPPRVVYTPHYPTAKPLPTPDDKPQKYIDDTGRIWVAK